MTYWVAGFADIFLTDENHHVILFDSMHKALDYARINWPAEYVFAQECVVHKSAPPPSDDWVRTVDER